MTVIAYRNGVLAADRMTCQGDFYTGDTTKIFRVGESIIGTCGYVHEMQQFVRWAQNGMPEDLMPKVGDEFGAFVCWPDGTVDRYGDDLIKFHLDDFEYVAMGCGKGLALGALAHGATAEEAVAAAIKHDPFCGGPIDVLRF